VDYPNFFESQKEAVIRLQGTVVLHDGDPVEIVALADHLKDGNIYAYVRPIGLTQDEIEARQHPSGINQFNPNSSSHIGLFMDEWMKKNPSGQISRIPLSSLGFNKFRPYELGMYWDPPFVYYIERQPNRKTEQGLVPSMLVSRKLSLNEEDNRVAHPIDLYGPEMYRCIKGEHPSPNRCLEGLTGSKYANNAAAFHRHFAFIRGPIDTLFLAYKTSCVGVLPHGDLSQIRLSRDFIYTKEVVDELHLFNDIRY
jgi:hypothetical protein